jgi:hypothetical protein
VPDRLTCTVFRDQIETKQWVQGSSWDEGRTTRDVTSLYIPLRLQNQHPDKGLEVLDVAVRDELTGRKLDPPRPADIKVGDAKRWAYLVIDRALTSIFNSSTVTLVRPRSHQDVAVALQDTSGHVDHYDIRISFTDNYDRTYELKVPLDVKNHVAPPPGTTEWRT